MPLLLDGIIWCQHKLEGKQIHHGNILVHGPAALAVVWLSTEEVGDQCCPMDPFGLGRCLLFLP